MDGEGEVGKPWKFTRNERRSSVADVTGYYVLDLLSGDIESRVWGRIVAVSFSWMYISTCVSFWEYQEATMSLPLPPPPPPPRHPTKDRGKGEKKGTYPSKFAETTVPFDAVPARGKALAETKAATERMETIVDVTCILKE